MSITLNLNQARELLEFFGGEDADMTVGRCGPEAHSGPGLYAWLTEHPGEGSVKLDEQPPCPDCNGTGADDPGNVDTVPCGQCGGTGTCGVPAAETQQEKKP